MADCVFFYYISLFLLLGVSVCQPITECMYSSPFLCRPCGESHSINHTTWMKLISALLLFANCSSWYPFIWKSLYLSWSQLSPLHLSSLNLILTLAGQPSSHSIKHARWLVVTTTSQAACSSPGSATIRAGSPPTRYASMSGTPCRTCSHTVPILPCSSLMRKYPDPAAGIGISLGVGIPWHLTFWFNSDSEGYKSIIKRLSDCIHLQ